jgi:hypothetical protein
MEQMSALDSLNLREKKKYSDVPESWKLKPLCCLSDVAEKEIYYAASEGGAVSKMAVFHKSPDFAIYLLNKKGEQILSFKKHAGIFANKLEVFDMSENLVGTIQTHGSSKACFQVLGPGGQALYDIEGPLANSEIFHILKGGARVGRISKRPISTAEAGDSQCNHFGIVFPFTSDPMEKGALLGALFLIDLTF